MLLESILSVIASVLLVPAVVLWVECVLAAVGRDRPTDPTPGRRASEDVAVLVPAHNESSGIERTLESVCRQLEARDRLVVVADNCSDDTAEVVRAWTHRASPPCRVEVIERRDSEKLGKGYALQFGVNSLRDRPPAVLIIVDADCEILPGAIAWWAEAVRRTGRPVQGTNRVESPQGDMSPKEAVSALAFRVRNRVRPRGLARLGLPCPLFGAGMAFPFSVIERAPLASGNIVEDLQLGVDLTLMGFPPVFEPRAVVTSDPPSRSAAAIGQRTRWEHGHLATLVKGVPRLLWSAVSRADGNALGLGLDLLVPPLALHGVLITAVLGVAGIVGAETALVLAGIAWLALASAVAVSWIRFGRDLPLSCVLAAPLYVAWKLPMYLRLFGRRQKSWNRTERSGDPAVPADSVEPQVVGAHASDKGDQHD